MFVPQNQDVGHTILMITIYLLLKLTNIGCTVSKLYTQVQEIKYAETKWD